MPSINHTLTTIRALGACAIYNRDLREYRVGGYGHARSHGDTCGCYYTQDSQDAIDMARVMARDIIDRRDRHAAIATELDTDCSTD